MNKRIKQLAEQAGVFVGDFAGAGLYSIHNKEEVEKFAELIVRECASVNYNSPFQDGEFHAREVLEHFGVK
jgi:hypothetical protein